MATKLPPEDHITRYVPKNRLRRDENGNVLGALPQAFQLREGEEFLSVTWVEHFSRDYEQGLAFAVAAVRRQLTVKPKDGFTTGVVGTVVELCAKRSVKARILHEPEPPANEGHTGIRGIPRDDVELLALLADEAFLDTRTSVEIP